MSAIPAGPRRTAQQYVALADASLDAAEEHGTVDPAAVAMAAAFLAVITADVERERREEERDAEATAWWTLAERVEDALRRVPAAAYPEIRAALDDVAKYR